MAALQKLLALVNGRLAQISPVQTSAGAASAGLVPALGAGGVLDGSMVAAAPPVTGMPSGFVTLVSPNRTWNDTNSQTKIVANQWMRSNVLWRFAQSPAYLGIFQNYGSTAGNGRIVVNSVDPTTGNPSGVVYDSGSFAIGTGGIYLSSLAIANKIEPGVYLFDYCGDSAQSLASCSENSAGVVEGAWSDLIYQVPAQVYTYAGAIATLPPATKSSWVAQNPAVGVGGNRLAFFGQF